MTHGTLAVLSLLLVPNTPNVKLLPNGVFTPVSAADLRRKQARRLQLKNLLYNPDYDGCDLTDKTAWPHSWERGDERKVLRAKVAKYTLTRGQASWDTLLCLEWWEETSEPPEFNANRVRARVCALLGVVKSIAESREIADKLARLIW